MGVVVNTNISSISAARTLATNRTDLQTAMERLSSGKRINSAKDDAAGMAVAAKMHADIRSLNQAVRNTNDAISLVNTYDGAAAEIENILVRMRELAVQSKNGTYQDADRTNADYEYTALKSEIKRIADVTTFNRQLLANTSADTNFSFYVGSDVSKAGNTVTFSAGSLNLNSSATGAAVGTSLKTIVSAGLSGTDTGASAAVAALDTAISALAGKRANAGALVNRLEHTVDNLTNVSQYTSASRSTIQDADYAKASSELARTQIIQQAATAVLAQANTQAQSVLKLLQ